MMNNNIYSISSDPGCFYYNTDDKLRDQIIMDNCEIISMSSESYIFSKLRKNVLDNLLVNKFIDPAAHVGCGVNIMDIIALLREFPEITLSGVAYDTISGRYSIDCSGIECVFSENFPNHRKDKIIYNMESFDGDDADYTIRSDYIALNWSNKK